MGEGPRSVTLPELLGFEPGNVHALDASHYEGADIVHDLGYVRNDGKTLLHHYASPDFAAATRVVTIDGSAASARRSSRASW